MSVFANGTVKVKDGTCMPMVPDLICRQLHDSAICRASNSLWRTEPKFRNREAGCETLEQPWRFMGSFGTLSCLWFGWIFNFSQLSRSG